THRFDAPLKVAFLLGLIVTRRPLVLQLHKTQGSQEEYAESGHMPRRRFTDFSLVDTMVAKTRAWEEDHQLTFMYDGVSLLAMLDEYACNPQA
ncbi:hypothetical protein M8C21_001027, partial [Ambrosia artemisiifolia]